MKLTLRIPTIMLSILFFLFFLFSLFSFITFNSYASNNLELSTIKDMDNISSNYYLTKNDKFLYMTSDTSTHKIYSCDLNNILDENIELQSTLIKEYDSTQMINLGYVEDDDNNLVSFYATTNGKLLIEKYNNSFELIETVEHSISNSDVNYVNCIEYYNNEYILLMQTNNNSFIIKLNNDLELVTSKTLMSQNEGFLIDIKPINNNEYIAVTSYTYFSNQQAFIIKYDKDFNILEKEEIKETIPFNFIIDNNSIEIAGYCDDYIMVLKYDLNFNLISQEKLNLGNIYCNLSMYKSSTNDYFIYGENDMGILLYILDENFNIKNTISNPYSGEYGAIFNIFEVNDGYLCAGLSSDINTDKTKSILIYLTDTIIPPDTNSNSSNLDVLINAENTLEMCLSTNQITFDNYNGTQDFYNNDLDITVRSSLPYALSATMLKEISSSSNNTMPSNLLSIKENSQSNYIPFDSINSKINLLSNVTSGENIHNIGFKLKGSSTVKADSYSTTIKFEAEQK